MPIHRVSQGECISTIARDHGFADAKVIYQHPDNEALREKRPDPNVLLPGDRVFVPDRETKEVERATGKNHRFKVRLPPRVLRVVVKDRKGEPIPDSAYRFRAGEVERDGTTSGGLVDEKLPAEAKIAEVFIPSLKLAMRFDLAHLDPHDAVTGAQQRLRNLRWYAGKIDGDLGPRTKAALAAFQRASGLEETGALDDATSDALRSRHGC